MNAYILRGNFIWSFDRETVRMSPRAYGVCDENGRCAGVFSELPVAYSALPVRDLSDVLIVPGYCDMHLHASQYQNIGLGMDRQLIQWLDGLTYPEEARFREGEYAQRVYSAFANELRSGFTTRAAVFATAHRDSTKLLMRLLDKTALKTFVGKVSMDRAAPDGLREKSAAAAAEDEALFLQQTLGVFENAKPIVTPRFVPSCSPALLQSLGKMSRELGVPVQSHLDETPEEVAWVRRLCPEAASYAEVYERAGLLGKSTLMAHCIYMTPEERALMKRRQSFVVHCPASNTNMRSGIAPVRRYLEEGISVALGSDISGGHTLDMAEVVRQALSASRLLWRLGEEHLRHLSAQEAFYLATVGGGSFFGRVGQFEPGCEFDAVAVDDSRWRGEDDDLSARFQKMIYNARSSDVTAKYVAGQMLF